MGVFMAKIAGLFLMLLLVGAANTNTQAASAEQSFYKGKTIRIIVGFAAGGGFDAYARAIARNLSRHIPGNPAVIVDNMTGAGSRIAANYLYKTPPDGLIIGNFIGSLVLQQIMGDKSVEFDGRKFEWLGAPVQDETVCAITKASGINSLDDWFAAKKPVKLGGEAPVVHQVADLYDTSGCMTAAIESHRPAPPTSRHRSFQTDLIACAGPDSH